MIRLQGIVPRRPAGRAWTGPILVLGALLAASAAAEVGPRTGAVPTRTDPPAVLVRLAPGTRPAAPLAAYGRGAETAAPRSVTQTGGWSPVLAAEAPFADMGLDAAEPLARTFRLVLLPGSDPRAVATALAVEPGVEAAWVEGRYRVAWADGERFLGAARMAAGGPDPVSPDDPLFIDGSQWGLRNDGTGPFGGIAGADIRAPAGWAVTTGSTAVPIAIVDTGMDPAHPELGGTLAGGGPRIIRAFNSSIEGEHASPADSVGHGTMVAGIAVARTNNGPQLDGRGIAGVAGGAGGDSAGCRVIAIKATPTRLIDALSTELSKGIIYAVSHGARAINLSFASDHDDDNVLDAISYAARAGCVVVCGAGNAVDERPQFPGYYARYGAGVSVAALKPDGSLAGFSSRGPQIDVAAPGDQVWSTYLTYANAFESPTRNFEYSSGTSFAAPFVTGLAGLVAALQPSLTDNEFQHLLRHTARDVGEPGRDDTYGWGVPDAGALLDFAAPPRGFLRGTATAQTWTRIGFTDSITLRQTRIAVGGCPVDGRYRAQRWEVRARVDLPPGAFLETPLGIVRTHATRGWGPGTLHEYNLGWGEVVPGSAGPDGFTLRTYVYLIPVPPVACGGGVGGGTGSTPIDYIPVRPENVVFAWSAFGRMDVPLLVTKPRIDGAPWSVDTPDTLRWEVGRSEVLRGFHVEVSWDSGRTWHRLTSSALPPETRSFAFQAPCAVASETTFLRLTALRLQGTPDQVVVVRRIVPDRACASGELAAIRLTSPAEDGSPWPVDAEDTLRWEASGPGVLGGFHVDVSWDTGRTWRRLTNAALPPWARAYPFRAPCAVAGESTFVRLTALDANGGPDWGVVRRRIEPARTCAPGEQPTLTITIPAEDGTTWPVDLERTLFWATSDAAAVTGFLVDVSWDSGRTWRRLTEPALPREARGLPFRAPCAVEGEQAFVRVIALETREGAPVQTEVQRLIVPARACEPGESPTLRITEPEQDGAAWPVDAVATLRWEAGDPAAVNWFVVDVSWDSGRNWRRLTEPALSREARSYAFPAPCSVEGEETLVRLGMLETRGGVPALTEVERRITPSRTCESGERPPLDITVPAADGAAWPVDVADTLRWEVNDDPGGVTGFVLDLSWDSGRTWRRLTTAALPSDARSYLLAAPCALAGERTFVRLSALDAQGGVWEEAVAQRELAPSRLCLVGEIPADSVAFAFLPVAPNPARGAIVFRYASGTAEELVIHDARGRRVRNFTDLKASPLVWDGRDDAGRRLPSGLYFARLRADGQEATQRFVLLAE